MGDEWQNRVKNNNEAGMEGREEEKRERRLITNILDQQQHTWSRRKPAQHLSNINPPHLPPHLSTCIVLVALSFVVVYPLL